MSTQYWLERAWLGPGQTAEGVVVTVASGRFTSVRRDVDTPPPTATRLAGLTLPGLANAHSHAFHRALRGRTQGGAGTFWTWREQMYAVAARLDPDAYYTLARATYREMAAAGITTVGEFHYLHHAPDGTPYDDPNEMGLALVAAARDAGLRIALLDTCYLASGIGRPVEGVQVRFSDGDAEAWCDRVAALRALTDDRTVVGAALHSVRAVPRAQLPQVVGWARANRAPLHLHLSEQVAENDACREAHGCTPTRLLADAGVLGERTTAVHATHLTDADVALLASTTTTVCLCPTTERDLGDGIGPSVRLRDAGAPVALGSDSHAVVDLFAEMHAVEMDQRLATRRRGHWTADALLAAATVSGHRSLGFPDAGRIAEGWRADLVTVDLRTPRTAGTAGADAEAAVFAASAADVVHVVAGGEVAATAADRPGIGRDLERAVALVWRRR